MLSTPFVPVALLFAGALGFAPRVTVQDQEAELVARARAIHERVIADQRLKQSGRHLHQVFVIAGLRSKQDALEQAFVTQAWSTTKFFDQAFMNGYGFVER